MIRFAPKSQIVSFLRFSLYSLILLLAIGLGACGLSGERHGLPSEVEARIGTVSDDISSERYEKIYNEASDLWKRDSTPEQSTQIFKTLRTRLGKVESRALNSATEQNNASGPMKGHFYIVTYQTKFERGEGMETFTLIEYDHKWLLARYFVNSTAL